MDSPPSVTLEKDGLSSLVSVEEETCASLGDYTGVFLMWSKGRGYLKSLRVMSVSLLSGERKYTLLVRNGVHVGVSKVSLSCPGIWENTGMVCGV